jgi:hypothetical protein
MNEKPFAMRIEFGIEKVMVKIPVQKRAIYVKQLDLPMELPLPEKTEESRFFRPVINLQFLYADNNEEVKEFDPPIVLRVRYTAEDFEKAGKKPWLWFWNGEEWLRFSREKHHFWLMRDWLMKYGGWGVVNISHWGDPTIAWGT